MGPRFNGVEDDQDRDAKREPENASMGPRFNGVEDAYGPTGQIYGALASMGPRFNGVEDCVVVLNSFGSTRCFNGATL